MGDNKLSCMQLVAGIQEATEFERKAQKEKGVTGTNVAAAKERKEYLVELSMEKGCSM